MLELCCFFKDTATPELYPLPLHDTLPIGLPPILGYLIAGVAVGPFTPGFGADAGLASQLAELGVILLMLDRKSTRLNSSHANISYAVFCLITTSHAQLLIRVLLPDRFPGF